MFLRSIVMRFRNKGTDFPVIIHVLRVARPMQIRSLPVYSGLFTFQILPSEDAEDQGRRESGVERKSGEGGESYLHTQLMPRSSKQLRQVFFP